MIAGYILIAVGAGAAAVALGLLLGAPAVLVIAAYPVAGIAALLAAAALRALRTGPGRASDAPGIGRTLPHVLAVDDDPLVLDAVAAIVERPGLARVTRALSAAQALDLIARPDVRFDGFLLDIVMRETDGIELCRHLRRNARYAAAPIVMLTRKGDLVHMERAFASGASDYVVKPLRAPELRYIVTTLMTPGRARDAAGSRPIGMATLPGQVEDFAEPVDLSHVPGFLTAEAAQTFALRASAVTGGDWSAQAGRQAVFALCDAQALFAAAGPGGFFLVLERVARAFAFSASRADAFLTYLGEGKFLLIARGGFVPDRDAIAARVNRLLAVQVGGDGAAPAATLAVEPVAPWRDVIGIREDV